jgi:hypothetical protein
MCRSSSSSSSCTSRRVEAMHTSSPSRLASGQVSRRSQGTLHPSSGEPKVSNPWNNAWCKSWSKKARNLDLQKESLMHLILKINSKTNLIY